MSTESLIVRTLEGEEWGFIKRLIMDSVTRQIRHADVVLADTGKIVRVPWESFEFQNEDIRLSADFGESRPSSLESEVEMAHTMAMDLWP
ncbi:MAG: hypothetical protein H8K10_06560 [Nitrospira sp.]|nr:hypothetical protein [Nitrospira sp.]